MSNRVKKLMFAGGFLLCLLATSFVSWRIFHWLRAPLTGVDDANIFFVYAKHLAGGHGFVYNIGGERVEGFSSLLWVVWLSFFYLFSPAPEGAMIIGNIILVSLGLAVLGWALSFEGGGTATGGATSRGSFCLFLALLIWTITAPPFFFWAIFSLMETPLVCLLLIVATATVLASLRPQLTSRWPGLVLAIMMPLLVTMRPEGLLWGVVFAVLYLGGRTFCFGKNCGALSGLPLLSFLASVALLTVGRLLYFGYPLPNTYYAKISPDFFYNIIGGWQYFLGFMSTNYALWAVLVAIGVGLGGGLVVLGQRLWRQPPPSFLQLFWARYFVVAVICLVGLAVPLYFGGDYFEHYRFYYPLWPLLFAPLAYGFLAVVYVCTGQTGRWFYLVLIPLLAWCALGPQQTWWRWDDRGMYQALHAPSDGRRTGSFMVDVFAGQPLPSVGIILAGGIKVTYPGPVLDLMGLNSVAMAHEPGDRRGIRSHAAFSKEVFYREQPQLLLPLETKEVLNYNPWGTKSWSNRPLKGLLTDDQFAKTYTFAYVRNLGVRSKYWLSAYWRNDYLNSLSQETGRYDVVTVR